MEGAERLERFAVDYLTEQIESRRRTQHWGTVAVELVFKDGQLDRVNVSDNAALRPKDFEKKPAEAG